MKKLASTTWGADTVTLRITYTGRVRPVLQFRRRHQSTGHYMTARGTTAKCNFDRARPHQAVKFKRLQDLPMRKRLCSQQTGDLRGKGGGGGGGSSIRTEYLSDDLKGVPWAPKWAMRESPSLRNILSSEKNTGHKPYLRYTGMLLGPRANSRQKQATGHTEK